MGNFSWIQLFACTNQTPSNLLQQHQYQAAEQPENLQK
jgi:hypothetical protein